VLAFLATAYFDDVVQSKPVYDGTSVELVALDGDTVVGVLDVSLEGAAATIETIGVHPDHERRRIGTALLEEAIGRLPAEVETLDAWTRDDVAANGWYQKSGFAEQFRYLHVYASGAEADLAVETARFALTPVAGFFHADIAAEEELRAKFRRVHICRQYVKRLR
jgi:ribosomal protein S18 acetylase RimI-like enzyme